jgi:hypothetical protein
MSHGKKSKRKKHQQSTGHERTEGDAKLSHPPDHVNVSGKIEANLPPQLVEKYDAASKNENGWNRKQFVVSVVTAIIVFVYTTVAGWQGCLSRQQVKISQEVFDAVNRPYVGLAGNTPERNDAAKTLSIKFPIKNFGSTIPATNVLVGWKPTLDGQNLNVVYDTPPKPGILMPGEFTLLSGSIDVEHFDDVMVRHQRFDIEVAVTYSGPGDKTYEYCVKLEYLPKVNGFTVISTSGCTIKLGVR